MPKYLFISLLFISLYSCSGESSDPKSGKRGRPIIPEKDYPTDKEYTPELPPPPAPYTGPRKFCFEKREGDNGEDVTLMQFIADNDSLSGTMDYIPNKQAVTHGRVEGIMLGQLVNLVYTYTGTDGVKHQEQMIYKYESDKLFRKEGEMIERNGVLVLREPALSRYQYSMDKVKCK